ncbi:MAG: hypothetical protein Tp1125SUR00d2C35834131_13 [Prokaryotic dsDNA virus sp.]|nr:MAG: hypothetical protein Tp1125SUR00d2C35834131_13 [Prokaryotic dsDNA virus sp.]
MVKFQEHIHTVIHNGAPSTDTSNVGFIPTNNKANNILILEIMCISINVPRNEALRLNDGVIF